MGNEELKSKIKDYKIIDFQKDNDKLGHIDLIFALSNLKANVYKLPNSDKIKTFKYVGKITPSTITSTSTIVGYNILHLI
jgi:ubiquitin-activating enzyme E1